MCDAGGEALSLLKSADIHTVLLMQFCCFAIIKRVGKAKRGRHKRRVTIASRSLGGRPRRASNPRQSRDRYQQPRVLRRRRQWVLHVHVQGGAASSYAPPAPRQSEAEKLVLLASGHKAVASAASSSAPTSVACSILLAAAPSHGWWAWSRGCRKEGGCVGGTLKSELREKGGRWLAARRAAGHTHARLEARYLTWLRPCLSRVCVCVERGSA